jgi:hypothetical protein
MPDQLPSWKLLTSFRQLTSGVRATRRTVTISLLSLLSSAPLFWSPGRSSAQLRKKGVEKGKAAPKKAVLPARRLWHPIVRPDDLLAVDLSFENLHVVPGTPAQMTRVDPAKPGYLLVRHQPQAIGEEAFQRTFGQPPAVLVITRNGAPDPGNNAQLPSSPNVAGSRLAGRSQVAFTMPDGTDSYDYTLPKLLEAWRTWPMSIDSAARPAPPDCRARPFGLARRRPVRIGPAQAIEKPPAAKLPNTQSIRGRQDLERGAAAGATKSPSVKATVTANRLIPHPPTSWRRQSTSRIASCSPRWRRLAGRTPTGRSCEAHGLSFGTRGLARAAPTPGAWTTTPSSRCVGARCRACALGAPTRCARDWSTLPETQSRFRRPIYNPIKQQVARSRIGATNRSSRQDWHW